MKLKPAMTTFSMVIAAMLICVSTLSAAGDMELNLENTLKLEAAAVDVASSPDGSRIYVLTDQGKLLVYSSQGELEGQLDVGPGIDQISVAPKGETLLLNSRLNKTLQVVSLEFISQIDTTGSPYKGKADAPVTVAVFTDFQ